MVKGLHSATEAIRWQTQALSDLLDEAVSYGALCVTARGTEAERAAVGGVLGAIERLRDCYEPESRPYEAFGALLERWADVHDRAGDRRKGEGA